MQESVLPTRYVWAVAYESIVKRRGIDAVRGDTYAVAANEAALRAIDRAVTDACFEHLVRVKTGRLPSTQEAVQTLRDKLKKSKHFRNHSRAEDLQRSLDHIYRLTQTSDMELMHRSDEFQSASLPRAIPVPGREALGGWLKARADETQGTGMVHRYFKRLVEELPHGRDPWTVSRELMASLPSPGDEARAALLHTAHARLVRAIACRLSEPRPQSGDPVPPSPFNWHAAYSAVQRHQARETGGADIYAAAAGAAALFDIDHAVLYAHYTHRLRSKPIPPSGSPEILRKLQGMYRFANHAGNPVRAAAIRRSLDYIDRLTRARHAQLELRSQQFRSASHLPGTPVPDRPALERWLRSQADAAQHGEIEHSYFTRLLQELPAGRDPWTDSRELMQILPGADNAGQAARLRAAHRLLVQAMAGRPSQPAAVPVPGAVQASRASGAPESLQSGLAKRLNSRSLLSDWQVDLILSAARRAIDAGTLSVSSSQPEAWVRGLVGRFQASVQMPFVDLAESERNQESTDLQSLRKLLEELGELGNL